MISLGEWEASGPPLDPKEAREIWKSVSWSLFLIKLYGVVVGE